MCIKMIEEPIKDEELAKRDSRKDLLKEGEALFAVHRLEEAERNFLTVLEKDPANKEALNNLGVLAFQKGDMENAVHFFRRSLEIDPIYKLSLLNLCAVLKGIHRPREALTFLERALMEHPEDADLLAWIQKIRSGFTEERTPGDEVFLKHIPQEVRKRKTGMNICLFSDFDIAGNMTMLMHLINKYTVHKARCIIVQEDYLRYDQDVILRPKGEDHLNPRAVEEAEQVVAEANFFHIGRWPINFGRVNFNKILNKSNCIFQYFGTEYRTHGPRIFKMHKETGIQGISWWDWTMLQHGLLFYHIDHILDVDRIQFPPDRPMDRIKIVHSPTNRSFKKTNYFLDIMKQIKEKHSDIELILLEGLSNTECLRKKQEAHILFDQINVGMYALSALESLAMEQVVLCSLSNFGMSFCPDSPVIPVNEENLYEVLDYLITHPDKIVQIGKRGREYVKQKHSPERGIIQYTYLWDFVKNGFRLMDHRQDLFMPENFKNKEVLENPCA